MTPPETPPPRSPPSPSKGREVALLFLLVLSGAAALLHESVWLRLVLPILGAGALSAALVSAGALVGLAVGASVGGRLSSRTARPARLLAAAELLAAAVCLLVPTLLARIDGGRGVDDLPRTVLLLGVLTAAAVPMGATLPAALATWAPTEGRIGNAFRRLYGLNTLGAVAGLLLAAAWLLELLGNRGVIQVAAGVQLAVAALALLLRSSATPAAPHDPSPASPLPIRLCLAAFLAGGAGLVIQVAWVRRLTPVVGNTTQSFATVLATSLFALAAGSLLLGPRRGRSAPHAPFFVLMLSALPVALLPPAIGVVDAWSAAQIAGGEPTAGRLLLIRTAAAALLLVPSTMLGAAALPWLVRAAAARPADAGRVAGRLLAWNTAGSAVLALVGAALWLPAVGSAAVLRGSAGLLLMAAAAVTRGRARLLTGIVGIALLLLPLLIAIPDDGMWDAVGASFIPGRHRPADADRLFGAEGRVATVVVRDREGTRELWVDSKIVASASRPDRLHLALLGHLPMALATTPPERVAVIGLGTGVTARAVATWQPETIDVFELEDEVPRAARFFEDDDGGIDERTTITIGDGRHHLALSDEHYDVITSDPIHPGVAGSAALYSREHYAILAAHADLVCQWLPLYQLTLDDVRLALRTFADTFAHSYLFLAGPDALMVGSREALALDEASLRARVEGHPGLRAYGLASPGRLLGLAVHGPRGVRRLAGDGPLNTDDRLLLEFRAGRHWYVDESERIWRHLLIGRVDPAALLTDAPSARFEEERSEADLARRAERLVIQGSVERALDSFTALEDLDTGNDYARRMVEELLVTSADNALEAGQPEKARARIDALLARPDVCAALRIDAAELLVALGDEGAARRAIESLDWPRATRLRDALDSATQSPSTSR